MKNLKTFNVILFLFSISLLIIPSSCNKDIAKEIANQDPTCQITAPQANQKIIKGEDVTIAVTATDIDGNIVEVRFFIDNTIIGSTNSDPYTYIWQTHNATIGNHTIKAFSVDNINGIGISELIVEIIEVG